MFGWANVLYHLVAPLLGKIVDWIPGRKESMLNRIHAIREELHVIQTKSEKLTVNDVHRLVLLSNELSVLEERIGHTT